VVRPTLNQIADYLDEYARGELDNQAAQALRKYSALSKVAHEMVTAKTHEGSKAAYCEMIDLIKGKEDV
jgi:hypothetical protein